MVKIELTMDLPYPLEHGARQGEQFEAIIGFGGQAEFASRADTTLIAPAHTFVILAEDPQPEPYPGLPATPQPAT